MRSAAPSQPCAHPALPHRRGLHFGAFGQDDRRRTRLTHREPLYRRAAHDDAQDKEGCWPAAGAGG